jgi:hypothetical protein
MKKIKNDEKSPKKRCSREKNDDENRPRPGLFLSRVDSRAIGRG